ncbi:hypothetical protein MC885_009621, partial [Smutsia gigantea]
TLLSGLGLPLQEVRGGALLLRKPKLDPQGQAKPHTCQSLEPGACGPELCESRWGDSIRGMAHVGAAGRRTLSGHRRWQLKLEAPDMGCLPLQWYPLVQTSLVSGCPELSLLVGLQQVLTVDLLFSPWSPSWMPGRVHGTLFPAGPMCWLALGMQMASLEGHTFEKVPESSLGYKKGNNLSYSHTAYENQTQKLALYIIHLIAIHIDVGPPHFHPLEARSVFLKQHDIRQAALRLGSHLALKPLPAGWALCKAICYIRPLTHLLQPSAGIRLLQGHLWDRFKRLVSVEGQLPHVHSSPVQDSAVKGMSCAPDGQCSL